MQGTLIKISAGTNEGKERLNNEDNFTVCPDLGSVAVDKWFIPKDTSKEISLSKYGSLIVVADGMGGLNAGEVAAKIAIDTVVKCFDVIADVEAAIVDSESIQKFLKHVVDLADEKIKQYAAEHIESKGMGTTIVMAWLNDKTAYFCWCGDSRAYVFNPKSEIKLERVTKDHSFVQQMIDAGNLTEEEAFDFPESNIITRSLGDFPTEPRPDCSFRTVSEGDIILLCSDGLCGLCRDSQIQECMENGNDNVDDLKNNLINLALDAGGYDNVTVTLLEVASCDNLPKSAITDTFHDVEGERKVIRRTALTKRIIVAIIAVLLATVVALFIIMRVKSAGSAEKDTQPDNKEVQVMESLEKANVTPVTSDKDTTLSNSELRQGKQKATK